MPLPILLRRRFAHDPARWIEFRRRYVTELNHKPEVWEPGWCMRRGMALPTAPD
jgi:uncharacterized protein YeaO (DUF488 family)